MDLKLLPLQGVLVYRSYIKDILSEKTVYVSELFSISGRTTADVRALTNCYALFICCFVTWLISCSFYLPILVCAFSPDA